ncbi:unnamed protein product [Urochloa humidicola]
MPAPAANTTRSTCTAEMAQGTHVFDIFNYSLHKGMGFDKFLHSAAFSVGGHRWAIRFYPDCPRVVPAGADGESWQPIFVYLVLLSEDATVRASVDLGLIHPATGLPVTVHATAEPRVFKYDDPSMYYPHTAFLDRAKLEASPYLVDDRITIHCVVTVIKKPRVSSAPTATCRISNRIANHRMMLFLKRHGDRFGPKGRVRHRAADQNSSTSSPCRLSSSSSSFSRCSAPRLL